MKAGTGILENKYINLDEQEEKAVLAALSRRQLAGTAGVVKEYEQSLTGYFHVKHALAVSSGTAALQVLLYAYDIGEGDEVIVPPTAPIMSALPILAVGARPVFVDVRPDSFAYDTEDLKRKISPDTKAIVSVPMWGYPTPLDEVRSLAKQYGIHVIEDASHCHGSRGPEGLVGTIGDAGFFSTQERKMVTTGEGGFIVTADDNLADRIRELRDFGKPVRQTAELKGHMGEYGYLFGLNFRLAALSAALGMPQLTKLNYKIQQRSQNADRLRAKLTGLGWIRELSVPENTAPNYYSSVWFINHPRLSAYDIAQELFAEGVVSDTYRFGIRPLYELPLFVPYASSCPNAEQILQQIITLPTHEGMESQDINKIVLNLEKQE